MKGFLFLILILGFIAACGANKPASESSNNNSGEEIQKDATKVLYSEMSFDARQSYMAKTIIPEMGKLFLPNHPDFGCASCHGDNLTEVGFKMPNTLEPLDPQNMPFQSEDEKERAAAQFMAEQVVPKMANLLGKKPYDPVTHQGFGCFGCHATLEK